MNARLVISSLAEGGGPVEDFSLILFADFDSRALAVLDAEPAAAVEPCAASGLVPIGAVTRTRWKFPD
jgi:hypothetical protein